jgi:hypothetical protein
MSVEDRLTAVERGGEGVDQIAAPRVRLDSLDSGSEMSDAAA